MSDLVPQKRNISLRDGELSFLEWKASDALPPLHFAHANGFNAATYRELLSPLATRFHIRAWDARGHGSTSLAASPADLHSWYPYRDDMIAMLEDFVGQAGAPVLLAGHSMGATTSLLAAAKRPDLVRGLFLIEPVIMPLSVRILSQISRFLGIHFNRPVLIQGTRRRRAVFASREEMLERYRGRGAFRTWPDKVVKDYIEGGTRLRDDGQVELTCAPAWEAANFSAQGHNPYAALKQYKGSLTLLYAGKNSTCIPPAPTRISNRGGDTQVTRVDDATHFLPMEKPQLVRDALIALAGLAHT